MKKKVLISLFVILCIVFVFISYNVVNNIITFNQHRKYLKTPIEKQKIEDWMTLSYLKRHYSMDLNKAFWKNISFWKMSTTIKEYCEDTKINCDELILSLEKYKNGH